MTRERLGLMPSAGDRSEGQDGKRKWLNMSATGPCFGPRTAQPCHKVSSYDAKISFSSVKHISGGVQRLLFMRGGQP